MSWNILAPCWVHKDWYPSSYELASNYRTRITTILSKISSCNCDVVMIQEAQEDMISLYKEKLNDNYIFEFAPNNPTAASIPNGLLTLIHKDWKYAKETTIINGILDPEKGEAIQIIDIPSKNIHLINLHLDYIHQVSQAKMIKDKCVELLGSSTYISIMAGDLNAEKIVYDQFQWIGYKDVFDESIKDNIIPSYYVDPLIAENSTASIDHIFYDPNQVTLIAYGKAWDVQGQSLEDALKIFGSDHIYVWAKFNFI